MQKKEQYLKADKKLKGRRYRKEEQEDNNNNNNNNNNNKQTHTNECTKDREKSMENIIEDRDKE